MVRRKRKIKFSRVFVLLLLIALICVFGYMAFKKFSNGKKSVNKVKEISSIKEYGYSLRENATDYYKELFKKLDKVLKKKEVNKDEYATLVSQMFLADFFNLDNKSSKNDVGGRQFVYTEYQDDFEKYAKDTMYKSVKNNVYGNRKQKLPIVSKVTVTKKDSESFKYGENTDTNAYVFEFNIEYKSDMGYQEDGKLVLIHNDKKIEVVSMSSN